jgi:hypothetical protein
MWYHKGCKENNPTIEQRISYIITQEGPLLIGSDGKVEIFDFDFIFDTYQLLDIELSCSCGEHQVFKSSLDASQWLEENAEWEDI